MATTPVLLGKTELLRWAADVTKVTPCEKYGDLQDGLVYLALARELLPYEIDSTIVRLQRRGARDPAKNWSLLTSCMRRHGIPLHLCNRQAVERGHTRHCFNLLVLFYFLLRLAKGEQFSVDFAQPVDPQLAAFLQSPDSILAVGGATAPRASCGVPVTSSEANAGDAEAEATGESSREGSVTHRRRAVTRLSSPPSASAPSPHARREVYPSFGEKRGEASSRATGRHTGDVCTPDFHERSLFGDAPVSYWQDVAERSTHPHGVEKLSSAYVEDVRVTAGGFDDPRRWAAVAAAHHGTVDVTPSILDHPPLRAAIVASPSSSSLQVENQLLREELQYAKAVGQLLITQQRGSEAAAEMQAAATLQDELAKAELNHLHDLRQLEVTLTAATAAAAAASLPTTSSFSTPRERDKDTAQWIALTHRAEVAERTAAELYEKLRASHDTYDATLRQLRRVFHSLDTITEAARPAGCSNGPSSAHVNAAAYEEAVADAMMEQLADVPAVLRDAFHSQLHALLLTLNTLRVQNARLRSETADKDEVGDVKGQAASSPPDGSSVQRRCSPSSLQGDLAALCKEADYVSRMSEPAVRRVCRRLVCAVEGLHEEAQVARQHTMEWQQRYRQVETKAAAAEAALQLARSKYDDDGPAMLSARKGSGKQSASPQHSEREEGETEAAFQEVQRLYDRVTEVLVAAFSSPDTADMKWASQQLVSLLDAFVRRRQPNAAMERALAEQCETIAQLRREVRQRDAALERAKAEIAKAERLRDEREQRCAELQNEQCPQIERARDTESEQTTAQSKHSRRGWPGQASSPSLVGSPSLSKITPSPLAGEAHTLLRCEEQTDHTPLLNSGRKSSVDTHLTTSSQRVVSPCPPGVLRSPSPSISDDEVPQRNKGLGATRHSPLQAGPPSSSSGSVLNPHRRSPLQSWQPPSSPPSSTSQTTGLHSRAPAAATTSTNAADSQVKSTAATSSLLLSAAELERRKRDILRKYNVE
jgi:hypothetical protein